MLRLQACQLSPGGANPGTRSLGATISLNGFLGSAIPSRKVLYSTARKITEFAFRFLAIALVIMAAGAFTHTFLQTYTQWDFYPGYTSPLFEFFSRLKNRLFTEAVPIVVVLLGLAVLLWTFHRRLAKLVVIQPDSSVCSDCGYDLRSLNAKRCPECGAHIEQLQSTDEQTSK